MLVGKEKKKVIDSHYSWQLWSIKLPGQWIGKQPTIASMGNTGWGSWEPLVTTFSSTNQYMILFYVCFCSKTLYLMCMGDSLILNCSQWLTPEGSFSNTCIFSVRHITAFLWIGTLDSTSALCLGAVLNSEIINKKTTEAGKTWHPVDHRRDVCLRYESWNEKTGRHLSQPQLGMCVSGDSNLYSAFVCEWVWNTDFGVTNKFERAGKCENLEST